MIGLWPARGVGLGVSLIAGIFYVVAWELVQAMAHMDFAGSYAQAIIASEKAKDANAAALAKPAADVETFKGGRRYIYSEVTQEVWERFRGAPSKGRFVNEEFKVKGYPCREV